MGKTGRFEISRAPTFAGQPDKITGFLEDGRVHGKFTREDAEVADRFLELPRISSRQDTGAAR